MPHERPSRRKPESGSSQRRSLKLTLEVSKVPLPSEGLSPIGCPNCRAPLTVLQPDAQMPEQLLGICESCGAWYLVEVQVDAPDALLVHLPVADLMRQARAPGRK